MSVHFSLMCSSNWRTKARLLLCHQSVYAMSVNWDAGFGTRRHASLRALLFHSIPPFLDISGLANAADGSLSRLVNCYTLYPARFPLRR